jgi:hypothetical protein
MKYDYAMGDMIYIGNVCMVCYSEIVLFSYKNDYKYYG